MLPNTLKLVLLHQQYREPTNTDTMNNPHYYIYLFLATLMTACSNNSGSNVQEAIIDNGSYPQATYWQGYYYFTMQPINDTVQLWKSNDIHNIAHTEPKVIFTADSMRHIWSPELHRISGKWYLYIEVDHGNTDDHQLAVLENDAEDPMHGTFRWKGYIKTNDDWNFGIHPTSIVVGGQQYLLWSGWQHRRTESETQCIYIARMENPWTLGSERVMLSQPDHEWERQWINPDGSRSAYPIYVNENPEAFVSPDGRKVCVCYSASGIWTAYNSLGILYADANADLLNPRVWTKSDEPLFYNTGGKFFGISNISIVPSADDQKPILLFEAKWRDDKDNDRRSIFARSIKWTKEGLPDFGQPQ